ncbi:PucR family transcriptional regulator [Nocardia salmonicida]|uniref:PucR family transcriptional regulator n=1 Tax=Nocardia salmonicida TaxID=53431 RepID=UPI0012F4C41E|nr:helix-turn-helix domain-containing protein [Nocardia salmonicida]
MLNYLEDVRGRATMTSAQPSSRRMPQTRRELAHALMYGDPLDELASQAELVVHNRYDLVAVAAVSDAGRSHPVGELAQWPARLVRYLDNDPLGQGALHVFDANGGLVLLPAPDHATNRARYTDIAHGLCDHFDQSLALVELHDVARDDLRDAQQMIHELCRVVAYLGKPPGTYTLDDLALDYQLTRPSPARSRLASILAPLRDHGHLMETLQAYLRFGTDRKRVAESLTLHPNTVSYRLRRITEITGLNPGDPADSRKLAAAWIASEWQICELEAQRARQPSSTNEPTTRPGPRRRGRGRTAVAGR